MRLWKPLLAMACVFVTSTVAFAQSSTSAAPAERLVAALKSRGLEFVAARDRSEDRRYVAAMRIGSSLFVVSAVYEQPALINERLYRGDYEGAYRELNAASPRAGRFFVQDLASPGLRPDRKPGEAFDIAYESVVNRTAFDGDWAQQGLSREAYHTAFTRVDARYAQALETLTASLRSIDTT
jgi:hypothetical protein